MNIAFSCDENYSAYLATSMLSIIKNNKNIDISFYILDLGLLEDSKKNIEYICKSYNKKIYIIPVNKDDFGLFPKTIEYISIATYARLRITEYIKNIDKLIYFDIDTLTLSDISELWNIDLGDYYIGAVIDSYIEHKDTEHKLSIGLKENDSYFNAGILLLNMKKLYSFELFSKSITIIKGSQKIKYQDQDILNIVFKNKTLYIPSKFNFMPELRDRIKTNKELHKYESNFNNIKIAHYCGPDKPWNSACKHYKSRLFYTLFKSLKNKPDSWQKKVVTPNIFTKFKRIETDLRNSLKYNIK